MPNGGGNTMEQRQIVKPWDAAHSVKELNAGRVKLGKCREYPHVKIITDTNPRELAYPKGWVYSGACLKSISPNNTGSYFRVPIVKTNGSAWN